MNKGLLDLKRKAVFLYYRILKNHLRKLPPQMRSFGNLYVKHEFNQHMTNKSTDQQYQQFYKAWETYNKDLEGNRDEGVSLAKSLSDSQMSSLSQQQKDSLNQLMEKTKDL